MPTKHCRILLADDDRVVQCAVRRVVAKCGHELVSVATGAALADAAAHWLPDLIVLDLSFPDADGRDLLATLKANPATKHIPVLVWSARKDRDSESRIALSLGAEDYVEKSDATTLMHKIERVLLRLTEAAA
ncbi:MAG TPA: response regulator [Polyangiaceae bacterium]